VEHHNFDLRHWSGARYANVDILEETLRAHAHEFGDTMTNEIRRLFVVKPDYVAAIKKLGDLV
jgi:hypothetical protein